MCEKLSDEELDILVKKRIREAFLENRDFRKILEMLAKS